MFMWLLGYSRGFFVVVGIGKEKGVSLGSFGVYKVC